MSSSFISAEEALRTSLTVSNEELFNKLHERLYRELKRMIQRADETIRTVASHGGTSCTVYFNAAKFLDFGSDIYGIISDKVGPATVRVLAKHFPQGYKVSPLFNSLRISWGEVIDCDLSRVDQKTLVDTILFGYQGELTRRICDKN